MPPPSGPLDAAAFSPARDPAVLPHLVTGFRRCLGVPRHRKLNPTLVRDALRRPAARQDAILLMAGEIADAGHIHASLPHCPSCKLTLGELPSLNSAIDEEKGLRKVAAVLSHTRQWRVFFDLYRTATLPERIRLLSQSGHGSVTYLTSDTPAAYAVEPEPYRVALRKCCGIAALGDSPLGLEDSCPHCDLSPGATDEALERHIVRCPRAGAWHKVHARIATTMVSIPQEAGAPRDCVLTEVRGLRSADATRPGDVV
eukprot:jgi/Tetstr1/439613/TSEL_028037.t1